MLDVMEELLAIENQASKILKKSSDKDKIFAEILEMLKKEIDSKINVFFEDEINKYEKKIYLGKKKGYVKLNLEQINLFLIWKKNLKEKRKSGLTIILKSSWRIINEWQGFENKIEDYEIKFI